MSSIGRSCTLIGWFLVAGLAAGCAASGGTGTASPGEAAAPTPEVIAQGQAIFSGAGNCQVCHGAGGAGTNFGPSLSDGEWIWFEADSPTLWDEVATVIREGISEPRAFNAPMPAMGGGNLSDEQVRAVAAYVISLN